MPYKYMGCCAQGVVNVTAGMVGLPGGHAAQDLHSMLQLVNVACESSGLASCGLKNSPGRRRLVP